ncbi:MAG: formate hydrogenlyase [Eubacteriaceae bacterium]|nr:formate hydrogenlyase [Eubacteriaceae bacterium]
MTIKYLFQISIGLYVIAGFSAVILSKWHKISNTASNILCMAASVFGIAASIDQLISAQGPVILWKINSSIPLMNFTMTVDNVSSFFILMLSILVFPVSLYSIGYLSHYYGKRNVGLFNTLYSVFILSMILVFTASNTIFFFIAWEIMSVVSYFLVVFESEVEENRRAGTLYIIMTHLGAALMLIGFMIMYSFTNSFALNSDSALIPEFYRNIIFLLLVIGFGTKAGVVPLHIWLPYAHPAAPSNVSALMSGIMIKTAVYGILRFIMIYLGVQNTWWGILILVIGISSALIGVVYAFVENNIKKLLAFSSIENIGIIFIGLGICFIAISTKNETVAALALLASLFHAFNHTIFKGSLFLGAGSIHFSTHTKDMDQLGGLIKKIPIAALFILGGSLSISALVPFNGFIGEWLILQSIFAGIQPGNAGINILFILTVTALALAGALAAGTFIKFFGITFLGLPRSSHASEAQPIPMVMNAASGMLVLLCLVIGIFPAPFIQLISHAAFEITGVSVAVNFKGSFLLTAFPLSVSGNVISPFSSLIIFLLSILAVLLIIRFIGGKYAEKKYGTWDCGFEGLNSRMQYTATGFSKPVKIVFRMLFRPSRDLKITGDDTYHPESMEYIMTTESIFEKYIYDPVLKFTERSSGVIRRKLQTGSIHLYLIYMFAAILAAMLYNRLF